MSTSLTYSEPILTYDPGIYEIHGLTKALSISPVYRKGILYLPNGGEIEIVALCDSGAICANYIAPSLVEKLITLNEEPLPIRAAPEGAYAKLADGITSHPVEGILNLPISLMDAEYRPYLAILDFEIFPIDQTVDVFIGFPTLCTVLKPLFLRIVDEGTELYSREVKHALVSAVNLLPIEFERNEYEIRYPVWNDDPEKYLAPEEKEIIEEFMINPNSLSFVASRTLDEHYQDFLDNFDKCIFPEIHREGQPHIPVEVLEFKDYLRKEGWKAFQPTSKGWQGIRGVEIELEWKEELPRSIPCNPRPIPNKLKDKFNEYLDNMLKYFLKPSDSLVVTPLLCVPKPPDGIRVVGMYNLTVNKYMALTTYHIPNVRDEVQKCQGSHWFGNGDITRAFHQLLLSEKSSLALTVATPRGNYRPVGIPEGVVCGSHYLQEVMTKIMRGSEDFNIVLFDNLFFFGKSLREFLKNFKWILDKSIEHHVIWNLKKTSYSQREILFGMSITPNGYEIARERYQGILDMGFPKNVKEARHVLGVTNFTSAFCPRYAELAFHLFEMTTKKFNWDQSTWKIDYVNEFNKLKRSCTEGLVQLGFPNYKFRWIGYCDASSKSACSIIVQIDEEGRQIPLAIYSWKFTDRATRWPIIQQEAYSFYLLYKKGRTLLLNHPHELMTDHNNLLQIEKSERPVIQGIVQTMQQFKITQILHIEGTRNPADHATRAPILSSVAASLREDDSNYTSPFFSSCVPSICAVLRNGWRKRHWNLSQISDAMQMLELASSTMLHKPEHNEQSTVSEEVTAMVNALTAMEKDVALRTVHNGRVGHWGLAKTREHLDRDYPDHGITDEEICTFLLGCYICQKHNAKAPPAVKPFDKTHNKFPEDLVKAFRHIVSIDFVKLPVTSKGNIGASVFLNHFTRRFRWYAQQNNSSRELAKSFLKYYSVHGAFHHVLSDQGRDLMGECFRYMREYLGNPNQLFVHLTSIAYRPQGHGTEPTIKKIVNRLRDLVNDPLFDLEWDDEVTMALIEIIINFARNSETGAVPIQVETGDPDIYFSVPQAEDAIESTDKTAEFSKLVHDRIEHLRNILARNHQMKNDLKTKKNSAIRNRLLAPGSFVLHRDHKLDNKLRLPREGPYEVIKHAANSNEVILKDLLTGACDIRVYSENLSHFVGTRDDAIEAARLDNQQHEVSRIIGYKGDPLYRTSCAFLVEFVGRNSSPELIWKNWDSELDQLVAYEDFCRSRPELLMLLRPSKSINKEITKINRTAFDIPEGTVIYCDLRSWSSRWYDELDLPDHFVKRYVVKGIYGKSKTYKGIQRIDIDFPSMCERYINDHGMDNMFVTLWGKYRTIPSDSILVDDAFVVEHPFLLNEFHRTKYLQTLQQRIKANATPQDSQVHES